MKRQRRSLESTLVELSFAAPQVILHRCNRLALAGWTPSQRDRREFQRMGIEKVAAWMDGWSAMQLQAMQSMQAAWLNAFFNPFGAPWSQEAGLRQAQDFWMALFAHGLEPARRRVRSNMRRLARIR